jgi:hypothetical protein
MDRADDPGWRPTIAVLLLLVPVAQFWYLFWYLRRQRSGDPLVLLRSVFLSFSIALVAFGVVLARIGDLPNGPVVPWLPFIIAVSVISVIGLHLMMRRPLACASETTLARSYRSRFFTTIALTEYVALFAFVFTFLGSPAWLYDAAAVFVLIRFWTTSAPTRSALQRDQDELNARGCELSLIAALRATPMTGRGWRGR